MPCSHNTSCHCSSCASKCGCSVELSTKCSFYYGENLECIDVVYGDDLETVITNISAAICALTPSGNTYSFSSCDSNIDVTTTVDGSETNVEICLSSDITDQIDENTTDIENLQTCVENGVLDVVSDSLTITTEDTGECGKTLRIEYTPSASVVYDGIIYNNTTKVGTTGSTGNKTLKSFTEDFTQYLPFDNGSEVKWRATGQLFGDGSLVDTVRIEVWDANTVTQLYTESFGGFDKVNKQSWKADCVLTKISDTTGLLHIDFFANGKQNGTRSTYTGATQLVVDADVTGIDFTGLQIKIIYVHDSSSDDTYNFARQLMVEVRQAI